MKKTGLFLTIIFAGLLLFSNCAGLRVNTELKQLGIDFGNKDSILKLEQDSALFKLWISWKPIELLMTSEEKKLVKKILKIQDDAERNAKAGAFIKWFWERRDDNAYDNINEFKENFYNRVVEAQTRFARDEDAQYKRRCAYGKGWETDMGLIYILLGEPFDAQREQVEMLLTFFGSSSRSALMPDEVEIWYYEVPDEYEGNLFQEGAAWILFERDFGSWRFSEKTFGLFFAYENYYEYYMTGASINYTIYRSEIYKLIESYAKSYVYDEDLEFEDIN